jgi:hypothetical protein
MRKLIYTIAIGILLSCGGSGTDEPTPPPVIENKAPLVPTLIYPSVDLLCIENAINFQWNASTDPDGDTVSYQIQIAKDNSFTQIVQSIANTTTTRDISLEKGVAYYWRVSAKDSKNKSSDYSTVNSFYTEGEGVSNYLPFSPEIISPSLNAVVQETSATLEWSASDVDNDPLTYDVYFGTDNPPTSKVSTDQTVNNFTVNVNSASDYFWKVVVKDDKGGQTIGQVWNFKTD